MTLTEIRSEPFAPIPFEASEIMYGGPLELGLQELEPLEAPGWATWAGRAAAAVTVGGAVYGGIYAGVALSIIST